MLRELTEISVKLQNNLISSFKGLRVQVDPELKGNEHYVAVSEELYNQLQDRNERGPNGHER